MMILHLWLFALLVSKSTAGTYIESCEWRPTMSCRGLDFLCGALGLGSAQVGDSVRTPEEGKAFWEDLKSKQDVRGEYPEFGDACGVDGLVGPHGKRCCCLFKFEM